MKQIKMKISLALVLGLGFAGVKAQEAIPASGGEATGSNGSVNYTIGQVAYTNHTGANGSVSQGVQQAYEITVISNVNNARIINLECSAFPNPTVDFLTLKIEGGLAQNIEFQLYDISGKLIRSKSLYETETIINMEDLARATYFLKVINNQQAIKTFKIIKND